MTAHFVTLLLLGLTASFAVLAGGWIVSSRAEVRKPVLNALISLGAGFMLAAAIVEVIPRSLEMNSHGAVIVLAGYLFVHLVEHTITTHFHFGEETHKEEMMKARTAFAALGGLALHAFFDGALIAAGFWISTRFGILMFLAIVLHKIPEGFTAASIMRVSGRGRRAATAAAMVIGGSTLAGLLGVGLAQRIVPTVLPFSAGVTLYVAASDLIPEVNKESGMRVSLGVFLGVAFFFLSEALLDAVI